MNNLIIAPTDHTPSITFDHESGVLEIEGVSMPESSPEFYHPVFTWIKGFMVTFRDHITLNFKLEYFNTSTSKEFYTILERMSKYKHGLDVNWYYQEDDEQMLEDGQDLAEDLSLEFRYISYE